jgi:dolichol-phosphate mannosyltransferase
MTKNNMPHITVVTPVYKAENFLLEFVSRTETALSEITLNYEIILVEDCGEDDTWSMIESIANENKKIIGIQLSRNFGQHYAITCGLDHASGEWIIVMDSDLQDCPEEINKLYNEALKGNDIVLARRVNREDNYIKRKSSKYFYRTLGYLTGSEQDETIANFGIYNKKVIKSIISMRESIRYFPAMVKWVGFKTTKIEVIHNKGKNKKSNYNLKKLFNLAIDIILAFSDKPIRLVIKIGFLISSISFLMALYYFYLWITGKILVLGYSSLIISLWLLSGFIISILGVIGLYVGKTFEGVKQRPIYIIGKKIN